jgi:hypothetical protein
VQWQVNPYWVFLSFHWVFERESEKKESQKGKKGRIMATDATILLILS